MQQAARAMVTEHELVGDGSATIHAATGAEAAAAAEPVGCDSAVTRRVIDRWLAAQNEHNFAA